jgi:hypothetical protein
MYSELYSDLELATIVVAAVLCAACWIAAAVAIKLQ